MNFSKYTILRTVGFLLVAAPSLASAQVLYIMPAAGNVIHDAINKTIERHALDTWKPLDPPTHSQECLDLLKACCFINDGFVPAGEPLTPESYGNCFTPKYDAYLECAVTVIQNQECDAN